MKVHKYFLPNLMKSIKDFHEDREIINQVIIICRLLLSSKENSDEFQSQFKDFQVLCDIVMSSSICDLRICLNILDCKFKQTIFSLKQQELNLKTNGVWNENIIKKFY